MLRRAGREPSDAAIARVYRAALAVAADSAAAEDATARVFAAGHRGDLGTLVATAVRLALRAAPGRPFAAMALPDAEAVAVTKYSGLDEAGAAACLGLSRSELRSRLVRGLTAVGTEPACAA